MNRYLIAKDGLFFGRQVWAVYDDQEKRIVEGRLSKGAAKGLAEAKNAEDSEPDPDLRHDARRNGDYE